MAAANKSFSGAEGTIDEGDKRKKGKKK